MPAYKYKNTAGKTLWYANFYYTDWLGNRVRKCKRGFATQREAKEYEKNFLASSATDPTITFGSLIENYMKDCETRLKPTTLDTKKWIIDKKLLPFFKDVPINEIDQLMIRRWQNQQLDYRDENGDPWLSLVDENAFSTAAGNKEKHLTVSGTVAGKPNSFAKGVNDEMHINFSCEAGDIYWYYKLQYIDSEADRDNNVLPNTDNTDTVPAETPAHGYWKLAEIIPYKMEDREYTYKTFEHFGYDVINGGVRYTYDVTSGGTSDKDYYHFTAYGEVSDPPETGYPGEKLTMDLHCWVDPGSLEGNGNFSTYSSLYMGYCHNYLANWDYAEYACGNPWTNVNYDGTNENKTSFSSGDGYPAYTRMNESGQVCMIFPEGESGDILEIESLLHIGDRHPLTTTWKYVFVE